MRYFIDLSYNGHAYVGWQRQPNGVSIQEVLEDTIALMLQEPVQITGCGRTDSGVHARHYIAHLDLQGDLPDRMIQRLNRMLPHDIVLHQFYQVAEDAHARFDATRRSYRYYLSLGKDPFSPHMAWHYPHTHLVDTIHMQEAAALLLNYHDYAPFVKSNHDAETTLCDLYSSNWTFEDEQWIYHVEANRFLRGMVRLIVGMCLEVGQGKLPMEEVIASFNEKRQVSRAWSVPPDGLYLDRIDYPHRTSWKVIH